MGDEEGLLDQAEGGGAPQNGANQNNVVTSTTFPHISPPIPYKFQSNVAEWKIWKQTWANYAAISRLQREAEDFKIALFLHAIGPEALNIFNTMEFGEGEDKGKLDDIIKKFDDFIVGEVNETYERYKFNQRVQEDGESIDVYVTSLRSVAKTCGFCQCLHDSLIRDRIVLGVRNNNARKRLLPERKLSLSKAIDICKSSESTSTQLKAMQGLIKELYAFPAYNNYTDEEALAIARQVLSQYPLTDGHNDLPWQYRERVENRVDAVDLSQNISEIWPDSATDIPRLREGQVGAQFWAAYIGCDKNDNDAVRATLEQVDVIHRMIDTYPDDFRLTRSADEVEAAFSAGLIAGLIGVEGGHSLDSSTAVLRLMYDMGVRYLGLTHNCDTPWSMNNNVDELPDPPTSGLSNFGLLMIEEMNRLGMIIDLSHVSKGTMVDAITASQAPVIFSHSNTWTLCQHTRNVQDDVLLMLQSNQGVIMVTFVRGFLSCFPNEDVEPDISMVADHIEYIRDLIGVDHVGIGGDYDGTTSLPDDLQDVSRYPYLFAELVQRGWNEEDLEKLAGRNVIRVLRSVEQVRDSLNTSRPVDDWVPLSDLDPANECRTLD